MSMPRNSEKGSALVELSIVAVFLVTLTLGVIDFGLAWLDRQSTETAVRGGARTGANLGDDRHADYNLLRTMRAALADIPNGDIVRVVVFKASPSGVVPAACASGSPQTGLCNVYAATHLEAPQSTFSGTSSCGSTAPDRFWCPTTREDSQADGADYLGVWVELSRPRVTGIIPGRQTVRSTAVMRLEPNAGGNP